MTSLSEDQQRAREAVASGRNVFVTGAGGTGKSHLVREMVQHLEEREGKRVLVTGTTGIAALQVKGCTLHSALGLGLAEGSVAELIRRALSRPLLRARWQQTHVLIIDEVSMLQPEFLEKVERVVSALRGCPGICFGGLQLVLVGDFHQLPPVHKERDRPRRYCFQQELWKRLDPVVVELETPFRQQDPGFIGLLARVRTGTHTRADEAALRGRLNAQITTDGGVEPTQLHSSSASLGKSTFLRRTEQAPSADVGARRAVSSPRGYPAARAPEDGEVWLYKNINFDDTLDSQASSLRWGPTLASVRLSRPPLGISSSLSAGPSRA